MTGKQADKVAWAILYFLLATLAALIAMGVYIVGDLVF